MSKKIYVNIDKRLPLVLGNTEQKPDNKEMKKSIRLYIKVNK
jgi:hypothetical protein